MREYEMYENISFAWEANEQKLIKDRVKAAGKKNIFIAFFARFIVIGVSHWRLGINSIRRIDEVIEFRLQKPLNTSWRARAAWGF